MKKIIIIAIGLTLANCKKKETVKPVQQQTVSTTTFCWYQVFNGTPLFYKCTSTQQEYTDLSIYCATNQMNMIVKQKNSCAECLNN